MALEKLQVINEALELIRAKPIRSLDDTNSNSARVAKNLYDSVVNDIFARYAWSFALKKEVLNQTTQPLNEFRFAHVIPTEAYTIRAVYNSRAGNSVALPTNRYDIILQGDTRVIVSDYPDIIVEYIVRVDPSLWSPPFRKLIAYALAADMSLSLTEDKELHSILQTEAYGTPREGGTGGRFQIATLHDVQQKPPTKNASSPLADARFGGRG